MGSLLESSLNTRDLGGYVSAEGRKILNNRIWRSDVPINPSTADVARLLKCNMTTIIDVRTKSEICRVPNLLSKNSHFYYYSFPIEEGSSIPESLEAVPVSYMNIAKDKNITAIFRTLAEAPAGVLIHCTAGKDRTGVISAILLLLCGVKKADIIRDYVISRDNYKERLDKFLKDNPEIDRNIIFANEKSMDGFIQLFFQEFATVKEYFYRIGITTAQVDSIIAKMMLR